MSKKYHFRTGESSLVKIDIINILTEKMKERKLADIMTKELYSEVGVSKRAYHNMFPKKIHMVEYYVYLWELKLRWHSEQLKDSHSPIDRINEMFSITARQFQREPQMAMEAVSRIAEVRGVLEMKPLNTADKIMVYGAYSKIEKIETGDIYKLFMDLIYEAVKIRELHLYTDKDVLEAELNTILFGAPYALAFKNPEIIETTYKTLLDRLWKEKRLKLD